MSQLATPEASHTDGATSQADEGTQTIGEVTTAVTTGRVNTVAGRREYQRIVLVEAYPDRADNEIVDQTACSRCGGTGYMVGFEHVEQGRCFKCAGLGGRADVTAAEAREDARKRVDRQNDAERKRIKRNAARDAEFSRIIDIDDAWQSWQTAQEENSFIANLVEKIRDGHQLTDKQIAAGAEAIRRDTEHRATRAAEAAAREGMDPLQPGRRELTLTVISTRWDDNPYGAGATRKMLAEDEAGYRYWSTVPRALINETVTEGTQISLTATVKPSERDKTFGLLSRPAKATTQG